MVIKTIRLRDFRNYENAQISDLHPNINIITGNNAQGKTNLIEAMTYLASAKSFRNVQDCQLIRYGQPSAHLYAEYTGRSNGKLEATLLSDGHRSIRVNGLPIRKVSEMIGRLNCIIFAPEDIKAVKESPSLRRRLIDLELSKIKSSYYLDLQQYSIALKSKNRLLKEFRPDEELLNAYNTALVSYGSRIIARRKAFIDRLDRAAAEIHGLLSGGKEELSIVYRSCCDPARLPDSFTEKLESVKEREREFHVSLAGPHREDLTISINGQDSKFYASQGQQRTVMLSLKFACARIAYEITGEYPVILLDDVFSELDLSRREALLSILKKYQVFITSTDNGGIDAYKGAKYYRVENGTIFAK